MNFLTVLVFILCLGSFSCANNDLLDATPELKKLCKIEANVGEKDLRDMNDVNVRKYYLCLFQKKGMIGNEKVPMCEGVANDNQKFKLDRKLFNCTMSKV